MTATDNTTPARPGVPQAAAAVQPKPDKPPARPRRWKRLAVGAVVLAALAAGVVFSIPTARQALDTVSTDDAYVNGHATLVAPRVPGQVLRVAVDDNARVKAGDLLIELDPEPHQVQVNLKRAAAAAAQADRRAVIRFQRVWLSRAATHRLQVHPEEAIDLLNSTRCDD